MIKKCLECQTDFKSIVSKNRIFCSTSCAAKANNRKRGCQEYLTCKCGNKFQNRNKAQFCSRKCTRASLIEGWKSGVLEIKTQGTSVILKDYLREKFDNKCQQCGWSEIHQITKIVPLQLEHIDGNSQNNREDNLKLLCPNCHSLTPTFGYLNKGQGRKWRHKK